MELRVDSQSSIVDRTSIEWLACDRVAEGRVMVRTLLLISGAASVMVTAADFSLMADMIPGKLLTSWICEKSSNEAGAIYRSRPKLGYLGR